MKKKRMLKITKKKINKLRKEKDLEIGQDLIQNGNLIEKTPKIPYKI